MSNRFALSTIPHRTIKSWKSIKIFDPDIIHKHKKPTADYIPKKTKSRKSIFVWGQATSGCLGNPNFLRPMDPKRPLLRPVDTYPKPHKLHFFKDAKISDVAAGQGFTLFAASPKESTSSLFGSGLNSFNQLGHHIFNGKRMEMLIEPVAVPLPLDKDDKVVKVAAGRNHSIVLTQKGSVYSMGNNCFGQSGRTIIQNEDYRLSYPHLIKLEEEIVDIVCGQDHSLFLTKNGEVYSCGLGSDGQTGIGSLDNVDHPRKVSGDISGQRIIQISGSADTIVAVTDGGNIFGWGNNEYFQFSMSTDALQVNQPIHLKLPTWMGKVIRAAAGGSSIIVLTESGQVYTWGFGVLGCGPEVNTLKEPTIISNNLFGCDELNPDNKVTDVFAGLRHFAVITSLGDLYTWGKDRWGCLGLGGKKRFTSENPDQDLPPKWPTYYFPQKVDLTGNPIKISLGVDHTVALCKTLI